MYFLRIILLLALLPFFGHAQKKEVKKTYWDNGNLKSIERYKNGVLHGISIDYYENGQKSTQRKYKCGTQLGKIKSWYNNGHLEYVLKLTGDTMFIADYDSLGNHIGDYGVLVGQYKSYHKNGNLGRRTIYSNKNRDFITEVFNENKTIGHKEIYKNGKRDGIWRYWDENGKLVKEEIYQTDKLVSRKEY